MDDTKSTTKVSSDAMFVVDLRSDTQTKPTQAMRDAMAAQTTGDDNYGEDETVQTLERKMCELFGKEAGLFVPSGVMANLIAMGCHCQTRGLEIIMGDLSHTFLREQGGVSQFCGVHVRTVPNLPDGTFDLDVLEAGVRKNERHYPRTGLICVENTQGDCGGKVLPLDFLPRLRQLANKHGLPIHLDASRLLNASVVQNVSLRELSSCADSVNMSFSKGIGAPVGSMLLGSKEFIARGIRMRKALGGGWRRVGGLAAAVLVGMEDARERTVKDHELAQQFANALASNGAGVLKIDVDGVHTNIIVVEVVKKGVTSAQFVDRIGRVTEQERLEYPETPVVVKAHYLGSIVRFITYSSLNSEDITRAVEKIRYVLDEYKQQ